MFINANTILFIQQQRRWLLSRFRNTLQIAKSRTHNYSKTLWLCWALATALTISTNCSGYADCISSPTTPITVTDETSTIANSRQLVNGSNTIVNTSVPGQISVSTKFTLFAKTGSFTASDGTGSYYRTSATATITLPASPGDGSVYKFKVTGGTSTFAFNGSDTINHAFGTSNQSLVLTAPSGVLELIAVPGGWDET